MQRKCRWGADGVLGRTAVWAGERSTALDWCRGLSWGPHPPGGHPTKRSSPRPALSLKACGRPAAAGAS